VTLAVQADAHSVPVGETEPTGREGGRKNLQQWRADVEAMAGVDAVLSLGDISDLHSGAEDAAGLIADMDNLFAGHGNHDLAEGGSGDKSAQKAAFRALYNMPDDYYAVDIGFVRLIVLDSCYNTSGVSEAATAGFLPTAQLTWLENELDSLSSSRMGLVCMHHPVGEGAGYMDADAEVALALVIGNRPNVFLLTGHRHPNALRYNTSGNRPAIVIRALCDERWYIVTARKWANGAFDLDVSERVVVP
jgi:hypothetical protein